jgi:hypothetical protein
MTVPAGSSTETIRNVPLSDGSLDYRTHPKTAERCSASCPPKGLPRRAWVWPRVIRLAMEVECGGAGSDSDQVHVPTGGGGQRAEVGGIAGEDLVTVLGQEDHGSIDHVVEARCCQQHPDVATHALVYWPDIDGGQEAGKVRLTTVSTSPHPPDDAPLLRGARSASRSRLICDEIPVAPFDRDESAGIENDAHPASVVWLSGAQSFSRTGVRTTTARARARRVAASIPCSVMSP